MPQHSMSTPNHSYTSTSVINVISVIVGFIVISQRFRDTGLSIKMLDHVRHLESKYLRKNVPECSDKHLNPCLKPQCTTNSHVFLIPYLSSYEKTGTPGPSERKINNTVLFFENNRNILKNVLVEMDYVFSDMRRAGAFPS